jgi:hypothetical protein
VLATSGRHRPRAAGRTIERLLATGVPVVTAP